MRLFSFSTQSLLLFFLVICSQFLNAAQQTEFSTQERRALDWLKQHEALAIEELRQHVEINTGTLNTKGLDMYRELLAGELKKLGFATSKHGNESMEVLSCARETLQFADHLVGRRTGNKKTKLLLNGHMDTVFSKDDSFQTLNVSSDGTLRGPGVADMKGGLVALLQALRALNVVGALEESNLTVLFNSDEEMGSLGSRPLIEALAREHDLGMVFESSYDNKMTYARKGLGQARLRVSGRESHAGAAHEDGVSANLALAHKVIVIETLTDYDKKNTVNVGTMSGGEKRNTIAGCAEAYIDMRYPSQQAGEQLRASMENIAAQKSTPNARYPELPKTEFWAKLHRPVKTPHKTVDTLIEQARRLSIQLGEPITGVRYAGGGTDGSIAQAVGLPTIDSIGVDGVGAHSSREASTVQSFHARTRLIAVLIMRLMDEAPE
ncbi:MAG: M20 family metallopeptidase [Pseudomonadales bacterium]